jgi:predicted pyridoxine 5'-phosphate oxidase superfamily flavin-nucleotide-binding protein
MAPPHTAPFAVDSIESLRARYGVPLERSVRKQLRQLDQHMRDFIALSPLVCMGTSSATGNDVTPRGDTPGFVHVLDDTTLLIPDWPGNNVRPRRTPFDDCAE